jgi:hypothetical protein
MYCYHSLTEERKNLVSILVRQWIQIPSQMHHY